MIMSQQDLENLANNPQRGINLVINEVENNYFAGTVSLNSKAHPAILMIDLILAGDHGFINRLADAHSKVFMEHARNITDLSRNMSDDDRFGLFALPSESTLQFAINVDSFQDIAKDFTIQNGNTVITGKKLLIPKDTIVTVTGYSFTVDNGIEIRYAEKTGYQVVYDDTTNNPFSPIETNLLVKDFKVVNNNRYLVIEVPVKQLNIKAVENITSNEGSGCRGTIEYPDYLYGVRAFLVKNNVMSEILVTYNQDVFNPLTPTLALGLDTVNNRFSYEMPEVYISNGLGTGTVQIYTYSTKGLLDKDLRSTPTSSISALYQDFTYGAGNVGDYSAPLRNAPGIAWVMSGIFKGGSNPIPFNTIKQNLINGRRSRVVPITEDNLSGKVEEYGYSSVKVIDYLTKRSYSVSKELPVQSNKGFYAPMSCYVGSHLASANDLLSSGVVLDNGQRITIPHNVLFDITNPTIKLINQITKSAYLSMGNPQLVDLMANSTITYTPFYYVMDMTNNQAVLRTYHLDSPIVNKQTFNKETTSLGIELGVGSIAIDHQDDGFLITVITKSSDAYKQIENNQLGVQLSLAAEDTNSLASIKGVLTRITQEKELVWEFKLGSTFDIDVNDIIYFNNFTQFGSLQSKTGSALKTDLNFIFMVSGDPLVNPSEANARIDTTLFGDEQIAIIETKYNVTLGKLLGNLYSRIRPLVGEAQYLHYEADIPDTYATNEYERDPVTGNLVFDINGETIIEHKAGDVKYHPDGSVQLLYRGGIDVVYENGVPVEVAPRDLKYHWDFIAFDANYYFSTDVYDVDFALATKNYFVNNISQDMVGFSSMALDRTALFYQPRSKLGYQKVVINNNFESFLKQDLSFTVTFYLTANGYTNQNLKDSLSAKTPQVINEALFDSTTIGVSNFTRDLMTDVGEEVVSVKISALSGDTTVDVISNVDSLSGFSIRKELKLTGDGGLSVKEALDVIFLQHDLTKTS